MASMFFNKGRAPSRRWGRAEGELVPSAGGGTRSQGSTSSGGVGSRQWEPQILGQRSHFAETPERLQGVFLDSSPFLSTSEIKQQLQLIEAGSPEQLSEGSWWGRLVVPCLLLDSFSLVSLFWAVLSPAAQSDHLGAAGGCSVPVCLLGGQQRAPAAHAQGRCWEPAL